MSMNDNELERFEAELRSAGPARPPAEFLRRLKSEVPALVAERRAQTALAAPASRSGSPHVRPKRSARQSPAFGLHGRRWFCDGWRRRWQCWSSAPSSGGLACRPRADRKRPMSQYELMTCR